LIPVITGSHWLNEIRFCKQWASRLNGRSPQPRMLWQTDSGFEANYAG
jgi:hypothetical protein